MVIMTSPYKLATDSPSRQLLWELNQLAISSQQQFYARLDHKNDEREVEHKRALAQAAAEHERVRRSAEQFREQLELQIQAERQRQVEEVEKELEKQRKEKLEREETARNKEAERIKAVEIEQKRIAELKKEIDAAAKQKREKEQRELEAAKRLQNEQTQRIEEQRDVKAPSAPAPEATLPAQIVRPASTLAPPSGPSPPVRSFINNEHEAEHSRYLEIHKDLKELRIFMNAHAKQNPELKKAMGEMRRAIKKSVGQVREGKGKGKNTKQVCLASPPLCID